jgi:hypothetical protein
VRWSRVLDGKNAFMHESLTTMLTKDVYATHSVLSVPADPSGAPPGLPRNLVVMTDWSDIDLLADPAKNILLSPWVPSTSLRTTIAATRFDALPRLGLTLPKERIAQASDFARDELSRQLLTELAPALAALASIAPGRKFRLSLCKTKEQSCPLFHTNRVPVRLLCTLRGPGTEWLDDAQVNRKALGRGDNRKIAGPEATVYAAQPFQVVMLKGDAGFGGNAPGIVHRSPAVPASMDGRWYLRVDPLSSDRSGLHSLARPRKLVRTFASEISRS